MRRQYSPSQASDLMKFKRNIDSTLAIGSAKLLNFAELAFCGTEGLSHEFARPIESIK
jgi:hypothetical protein